MQQGLPGGDVFRPSVAARIGSLDVDVSSVQVDREMPDPLSGGALSAASASLTATVGDDVSERVATPWDPGVQWPPAPEAPATVSLDMGAGAVQSLSGRVVSASGGTSGRGVSVEIADLYQTLERTISWINLADQMPHPDEATDTRFVGLHTMSVTDTIFRHCGWYATPPRLPYCTLSVPAMGTMWPEKGILDTCVRWGAGDDSVYPTFYLTDWGLAASYVQANYKMEGRYTLQSRGHMEMVAVNQRLTGGRTSMHLAAYTDAFTGFRLSWDNSTIYLWAMNRSSAWFVAAQVPRVDGLIYARIDYASEHVVDVNLRNAAGTEATARVEVHGWTTTSPYSTAQIQGDLWGGGFQVAFPSTGGQLLGWKRNAEIHRYAADSNMIKVRPAVQGASCVDLLSQQCAAENAVYWIDEKGVMQWWHLQQLELKANSVTLNSDDNIAESGFKWSHALSQVKSRVVVRWKDWASNASYRSTIDLWQGSGITMEPGSTHMDIITPPNDEIWIQPDLNFTRIGDGAGGDASTWEFNKARRSWWGGIVEGDDTWAQSAGSLAFAIQRVTDDAFKYTIRWTGAVSAELKTPSSKATTAVSFNKRSFNLPILRGKAKYVLTDVETVSATTGPATAPEHVIDAGWWIQEERHALRTADYAAARLTKPQPVLSAVDLIPVPGVQLGDMVTIVDSAVTGLTVRGLVTADSRSISDGMEASHSIVVRPLAVSRNGVTWQDWGTFVNEQRWDSWGARQQPDTWQTWGSDPLEVA